MAEWLKITPDITNVYFYCPIKQKEFSSNKMNSGHFRIENYSRLTFLWHMESNTFIILG